MGNSSNVALKHHSVCPFKKVPVFKASTLAAMLPQCILLKNQRMDSVLNAVVIDYMHTLFY